MLMAVKNN
jgi:hypothetical protein